MFNIYMATCGVMCVHELNYNLKALIVAIGISLITGLFWFKTVLDSVINCHTFT